MTPEHRKQIDRIDYALGSAKSGGDILTECLDLAWMLIEKNTAYGDSVLDPVRVLSRAKPEEQLLVRIDDKLSRITRGREAGEDSLNDLIGYLVLLRLMRKRAAAEKQGMVPA